MKSDRRSFLYKCVGISLLFTTGYSSTNIVKVKSKKIDFKRAKCVRCNMIIENRSFAAQIINPDTNEHYNFDDIGCAIFWFKEQDITWEKEAVVYVSDENSKKFINVKTAYFTEGSITPMNYGFSAHKYKVRDQRNYTFEEIKDILIDSVKSQN